MMWKLWITSRRFAIMNIPYCSFYTVLLSSRMIPQNKTFNSEDITLILYVGGNSLVIISASLLLPLREFQYFDSSTLIINLYSSFLQIDEEEKNQKKVELMNSGFHLTIDKVLATEYFKVNFLPAINDYLVYNFFLNCTYDV